MRAALTFDVPALGAADALPGDDVADTSPDTDDGSLDTDGSPLDTSPLDAASPPDALRPEDVPAVLDINAAADVAFDVQPPECTTAPDCDYLAVGNPCKVPQCKAGKCGLVHMPDGIECDGGGDYYPSCEEFVCDAGKCTKIPFALGTPCGLTDLCHEDRCNGAGLCIAVPISECDDGNECTGNGCHYSEGCFFQASAGKACGQGKGYCKCPSHEACTPTNVWCQEP